MSTSAHAERERRGATTGTTARERRIEESAESRLRRSGYLALRDIGCACRDGTVTLWGCLPTYYLKQLAQHAVAEIEGVRRITNEIEVLASSGRNDRWDSQEIPPWADSPAATPSLSMIA